MPNFTAGTSFTDGVTNDVTAAKLNALVADAVPTSSLSLNSTTGTIANFTASTANITLGTIPTLTAGTTTSTAGVFTSGTITTGLIPTLTAGTTTSTAGVFTSGTVATLNSTTGVIPTLTSTTLITTGTGTAASPAIVPTGDTNTGIFFPAADTIAFSEGGAEAMRIDSSGNVGIGATSPAAKLHIVKTISQTDIDTADQIINLANTATDTSGNLSGIRLRQENGTNTANSFIGLSSTGNSATRASLIIAAPNTSGNSTERLRIDSSGNVGIGTASPSQKLDIQSASASVQIKSTTATNSANLKIENNSTAYIGNESSSVNSLFLGTTAYATCLGNVGAYPVQLATNNNVRMTIDASGNVIFGKTSANATDAGAYFNTNGKGIFVSNADASLYLNRLTDDGVLVEFAQASTLEGTISVSGNTVSYNPFAGSHWSQLEDGSRPEILRGTVLESINQLCQWPDGGNERFAKCKISDTVASKKVYGVFLDWDNSWDQTNDLYVTAVGLFVCRINASVTVQIGDLLESNGDGTARVQADDVIRSSTIGKVTSSIKTHEHPDGSYCVPTVLYCG